MNYIDDVYKRLDSIESALVSAQLLPKKQYVLEFARTFRDFLGLLDPSTVESMNRLAGDFLKGSEPSSEDMAVIEEFNESYRQFFNYTDREEMLSVHWENEVILPEPLGFDQFVDQYREKHIIKIAFSPRWKEWRTNHSGSLKEFKEFRSPPVVEAKSSEPKKEEKNVYPIFVACD